MADGKTPPTSEAAAWWPDAACAGLDPEMFFPQRGESTAPAREVCLRCPVRDECLEYALGQNIRWGVWGGKSERQRRRLRRQQRAGD